MLSELQTDALLTDNSDMLVNYLWMAGGEISKSLLEALGDFVAPDYRKEFVGDLFELIQELEQEGIGKQEIAERVMREVSSGFADELTISDEVPNNLMKYLWSDSGELSEDSVAAIAELAHKAYRREFAGDLVELMRELDQSGMSRARITQRVVNEVREAVRPDKDEDA